MTWHTMAHGGTGWHTVAHGGTQSHAMAPHAGLEAHMAFGKTIGIDLGTSTSSLAIVEGGLAKIIENAEGCRSTPSVVAYLENGEIVVGNAARRHAISDPRNTLYGVKRLMGRKFNEAVLQKDLLTLPFHIVPAFNGDAWVEVRGVRLAQPQISAELVRSMKVLAEEYLGQPVTHAVITVPAYFNDAQRQATRDAGRIAGLEVRRILPEPTAAALAFGMDQDLGHGSRRLAVYDLGGGTFDISIIELTQSAIGKNFTVLAVRGDTFLGGEDFDQRLADHIVAHFRRTHQRDLSADPLAMQRLRRAAERARIELTTQHQTRISEPCIARDGAVALNLEMHLTRATLEFLVADLILHTIALCRAVLEDAGVDIARIDDVLLVGGVTRMPGVRRAVQDFFGRAPRTDVNPEEAVASGAALQVALLDGERTEVTLFDITPLAFGIETAQGGSLEVIAKNTLIPTTVSQRCMTGDIDSAPMKVYQADTGAVGGERIVAQLELELELEAAALSQSAPGSQAPQVDVELAVDADGILHVQARDPVTGRHSAIIASSGLSETDVGAMLRAAEAHDSHTSMGANRPRRPGDFVR